MLMIPEYMLSVEVEYRQQRIADLYPKRPRRHRVPRRPSLRLPFGRRRPVLTA